MTIGLELAEAEVVIIGCKSGGIGLFGAWIAFEKGTWQNYWGSLIRVGGPQIFFGAVVGWWAWRGRSRFLRFAAE